ncbi:MAG: cell wall-binding protein [Clostridiales bacterium]|jgi:hypothetical protein|nr:cell wall-binding protein [Clostridiales bacterium]
MQSLKQKFSFGFVALFTTIILLGNASADAVVKKVVLPKIQFTTAPTTEYTVGDRIKFNINALPYGGRVEYRVVLWEDAKKSYRDLWDAGNGHPTRYYTNWHPYGNETFTLGWPIFEPGDYRITVYVKRLGVPNNQAGLKGMNCDNYVESVAFKVKPKTSTLSLDKEGTTYGSKDVASLENFKGEVSITANNVTFSNANIDGNITITGDEASLNNVIVNGNIIVNPGTEGITNLENVSAKEIKVLSGSYESIHLKGVKADTLTTDSVDGVKVIAEVGTQIGQTIINTDADIEAAGGSFGEVQVSNKNDDDKYLGLIGNFDKSVIVKSFATIYAEEGAVVPKVEISADEEETEVALSGKFNEVLVKKDVYLTIAPDSTVAKLLAEASAVIYLDENSAIDKLDSSVIVYTFGEGKVIDYTGVVIEGTSDIKVPTAETVLGTIDPKAELGYIGDGTYEAPVLNMKFQKEDGTPLTATSGDLYVYDGVDTIKMAYPGGDAYTILVNEDGTLALAGGSYELYFPCNDKWYVLKFTTTQIGQKGELSSELISINGKTYEN